MLHSRHYCGVCGLLHVGHQYKHFHTCIEAQAFKGGEVKLRMCVCMVYLNRFLCVAAGMLAQPISLQCIILPYDYHVGTPHHMAVYINYILPMHKSLFKDNIHNPSLLGNFPKTTVVH